MREGSSAGGTIRSLPREPEGNAEAGDGDQQDEPDCQTEHARQGKQHQRCGDRSQRDAVGQSLEGFEAGRRASQDRDAGRAERREHDHGNEEPEHRRESLRQDRPHNEEEARGRADHPAGIRYALEFCLPPNGGRSSHGQPRESAPE